MKQNEVATSAAKHTRNVVFASAETGADPVIVAVVLMELSPLFLYLDAAAHEAAPLLDCR
jgi:hypothetical protein